MSWELFWKIVLVTVVSAFAVMSVLVTILGGRDVRRLLQKLRDEKENRE